jgi:hypothetical protein
MVTSPASIAAHALSLYAIEHCIRDEYAHLANVRSAVLLVAAYRRLSPTNDLQLYCLYGLRLLGDQFGNRRPPPYNRQHPGGEAHTAPHAAELAPGAGSYQPWNTALSSPLWATCATGPDRLPVAQSFAGNCVN